jgi:hypothetical protein
MLEPVKISIRGIDRLKKYGTVIEIHGIFPVIGS